MALGKIKINSGYIEGVPCGDPAYTVFKGVPYAKPPVGEYRWKGPVDPESWEGVRKCDTFAPTPVQKLRDPGEFYRKEFFMVDMPMSEDCLCLDVWTPAAAGNEKLPVMMWIHGGGYVQGYSYEKEFDGEGFCKRGVILVSIAYRLGALGFFAHPELSAKSPHKVSGNYAVLDAIHAMKWIRDNIAAFGGDPANVTIFGQSAGGGMVQALISSPLARGLFHKAIVQSSGGIGLGNQAFTLADAEAIGLEVCARAGKSLEELQQLPALELHETVSSAVASLNGGRRLRMQPNVDGYVLPDSPANIIAAGKHADVPYMTGSVSGDGRLMWAIPAKTREEFESYIRAAHGEHADKYLKLFGVSSDADVEKACAARTRAGSMLSPRTWAKAQLKNGKSPIFIYYFDRDMPGEDHPGAFHSSELWYVFGTVARCWRPMQAVDYGISLTMADYWANFAKNGDPNGPELPEWPAFSAVKPVTMKISEKGIQAADMAGDPILEGIEAIVEAQVSENR